MRTRPAAMLKDLVVIAPSILKSIGKDGHSVEGTVCVNAIGKRNDS
jgi:hypothetical protein